MGQTQTSPRSPLGQALGRGHVKAGRHLHQPGCQGGVPQELWRRAEAPARWSGCGGRGHSGGDQVNTGCWPARVLRALYQSARSKVARRRRGQRGGRSCSFGICPVEGRKQGKGARFDGEPLWEPHGEGGWEGPGQGLGAATRHSRKHWLPLPGRQEGLLWGRPLSLPASSPASLCLGLCSISCPPVSWGP